jgi:hypothetical protein
VDAKKRQVLQVAPLTTFADPERVTKFAKYVIADLAGGWTREQSPRVVLWAEPHWYVWTLGSTPVQRSFGYDKNDLLKVALAPGASQLLISRRIPYQGPICEERSESCPPPKSFTGVVASLHDVDTGRTLWSIERTTTGGAIDPAPAISPDGQFALIGMPSERGNHVALISMANGQVLQTFSRPYTRIAFSFGDDGRHFYISGHNQIRIYRLAPEFTRN